LQTSASTLKAAPIQSLILLAGPNEPIQPEEAATRPRGVRVEVHGSSGWRIRCLPPVNTPFRQIFRHRRLDRTRKFTKPLLYRLSYVGAYLRMIWHVLNDEARVAKTPAPLVNPTAVVFLDKFDHAERL